MPLSEQVPFSAPARSAQRQQIPWQGGAGITKMEVPQLCLQKSHSTAPCVHVVSSLILPWVPGAQWDWATLGLSLGTGSSSAVCSSRVRAHPWLPLARSLLLLLLCRETQKYITEVNPPSTPPPCSQQQRCAVTETISKGFNQSGCQSSSRERVMCNGKAF